MDPVQASDDIPPLARAGCQTEFEQLPEGEDAVLGPCEFSDLRVHPRLVGKANVVCVAFPTSLAHTPIIRRNQ